MLPGNNDPAKTPSVPCPSQDRYRAWVYWLVVTLISIVRMLNTDSLVDTHGAAFLTTTIAFSMALIAAFAIWYGPEHTLSIHAINTPVREDFYWLAS